MKKKLIIIAISLQVFLFVPQAFANHSYKVDSVIANYSIYDYFLDSCQWSYIYGVPADSYYQYVYGTHYVPWGSHGGGRGAYDVWRLSRGDWDSKVKGSYTVSSYHQFNNHGQSYRYNSSEYRYCC